MAKEYIEREALLDKLCHRCLRGGKDPRCLECDDMRTIADFPAADVAPVVHGRFEKDREAWRFRCSACSKFAVSFKIDKFTEQEVLTDYCPNCGAKMDKE